MMDGFLRTNGMHLVSSYVQRGMHWRARSKNWPKADIKYEQFWIDKTGFFRVALLSKVAA
jgi:hypothetical protein